MYQTQTLHSSLESLWKLLQELRQNAAFFLQAVPWIKLRLEKYD